MCRCYNIKHSKVVVFPGLSLPDFDLEVKPLVRAPAIEIGSDGQLQLSMIPFGSRSYDKLLLNARSETVLDKPSFHDAFLNHKAVFPCTSFLEMDSKGIETEFKADDELFFLLGFYRQDGFILLTDKGKSSWRRMPCLVRKGGIIPYLTSSEDYREFLLDPNPIDKMEQLSLF